MRKITILTALLFALPTLAQRHGNIEPSSNYDYRVKSLKNSDWIVEIEDASKHSGDGIPSSLASRVKIEEKGKSSRVHRVSIDKYPNEDGVVFIDVDHLKAPLFLVISKGGELSEIEREIHLISPGCPKPLASARAHMEDSSQIQVNTGVKDFMISFPGPEGNVKKTWTAPTDSSKLCQQKWQ